MKKIALGIFFVLTIVVGWCSLFKKEETVDSGTGNMETDTGSVVVENVKGKYSFEDENCNKYVALMECLLDKTPDAAKDQTTKSFVKVMELWQGLEKTALPDTCKNTMDMLQDQKEVFAKAGCELK